MSSQEDRENFEEIMHASEVDPAMYDLPKMERQSSHSDLKKIANNDQSLREAAGIQDRDITTEPATVAYVNEALSPLFGLVRSMSDKLEAMNERSAARDKRLRDWLKQNSGLALTFFALAATPYVVSMIILAIFWQHVVWQPIGLMMIVFIASTALAAYPLLELYGHYNSGVNYDATRQQWASNGAMCIHLAQPLLKRGSLFLAVLSSAAVLIWLFWNMQELAL